MPLDATPGGPTSNSYPTVQEYKDFWASRPQSSVALSATDLEIESLLEWATALEESAFVWTGLVATDTQALGWPRTGMLDRYGRPIPEDLIPNDLKRSVCQLAGDVKVADRTADVDALKQGITSVRAGSVGVTFSDAMKAMTLRDMDAAMFRQRPEFYWLDKSISDAARMLLVPSWYERPPMVEISMEVFR